LDAVIADYAGPKKLKYEKAALMISLDNLIENPELINTVYDSFAKDESLYKGTTTLAADTLAVYA